MVYSKGVRAGKRSIIMGKVIKISPILEIEYFHNKTQILLTTPSNLQISDWIRVFGVFRKSVFIADGFHAISQSESECFYPFRKTIRAFYKEATGE